MFEYLINAFFSGINFYINVLIEDWWWIFGLVIMLCMSMVENNEIESDFEGDSREVY